MAFHDVRFPTKLSFGSSGGPERRTEIVTLANGFEERNTPWEHSRRYYDAGIGLRSMNDIEDVLQFFEARRGPLHAFRWKDWADFKSVAANVDVSDIDQELGIGDGVVDQFQLVKTYRSGEESYTRPIRKPVEGTVKVAVGGVPQIETIDYSVDFTTGIVSFSHPPDEFGLVTAGFEFDVPVRFDVDRIVTSVESFGAGAVPSIPVVEVRT